MYICLQILSPKSFAAFCGREGNRTGKKGGTRNGYPGTGICIAHSVTDTSTSGAMDML
jgi:hypothetical protein